MIISTTKTISNDERRPNTVTKTLGVICPICGNTYETPFGVTDRVWGSVAACPDCRNDSGRRDRLTSPRRVSDTVSPFHTRPRLVGVPSIVAE